MRLATLLALPLTLSPALAHDVWSNGIPVPDWVKSSCCGKAEAHLVDPQDVHHNSDEGYYYFDAGYQGKVQDKIVLPSEDGRYWIFYACPGANCTVHCFFVPMSF